MKFYAGKIIKVIFLLIVLTLNTYKNVYGTETILRVAYEPHLPPCQFLDNDKPAGIHIDILNSIAKNNNFIIEYKPMKTTTECLEALEQGKADIVLGVNNNILKYKGQFTESIFDSYICIFSPNKKVDILREGMGNKSFTAALENNTIKYSYIQYMKNLKYIVSCNQISTFNLLKANKADILVGVKHSILYQLEKAKLTDEYTIINNYITPIEYAMVVKKGDSELLKKLNTGLLKLRLDGEYDEIYNKWINEEKYIVNKIMKRTVMIIGGLLIVFLFNMRINRLLKIQVNEKTRELQKINIDLENQIIETRNYNELQNCIVENSPSSIVAFDKNYIITIFNKNAYKLTGISECPIGENVFKIKLLSDIIFNKKDKVFTNNAEFINKEIILKNKYNEDVYYRYDIYQLYDFNNNVRGAILSIQDITEEIRIREEIFEKEKNKSFNQIIAGIAHEIRNPLMSIKTFAELVPTKKDNPYFQDQFAKFVPKEVDRANNLIKNLIDFAKPEKCNKQIISIKNIIYSSTELIEPILEEHNISLNISIENEVTLFADNNQLKQVLINIILNSFQSMKEKIENTGIKTKAGLTIKASSDEKDVIIQIEDEGMGMTKEQIKKSTDPFYTTKANGTGIGLWVSKGYVERNNGTMTIESEIGNYTKVILRFRR